MDQKSPDAFRTISEVSEWLDTPAHVLRFWESRFTQVKPVKRAGGRRYYRPSDMALLGGIKKLLHDDGLTIRGVQKLLRTEGIRHVAALSPPLEDGAAPMEFEAEADTAEVTPIRREPPPQAAPAAATPAPVRPPAPVAPPAPQPEFSFDSDTAKAGDTPAPDVSQPIPAAAKQSPVEDEEVFEAELDAALDVPAAAKPDTPASPPAATAAPPPQTAPEPPQAAPAKPKPDLSRIGEAPDDDSEGPSAPASPFPLRDRKAARAALAASPAKAAALYARLLALSERMSAPR